MPSDSSIGDVKISNSKLGLEFLVKDKKRIIRCDFPDFDGGKGLKANITLEMTVSFSRSSSRATLSQSAKMPSSFSASRAVSGRVSGRFEMAAVTNIIYDHRSAV